MKKRLILILLLVFGLNFPIHADIITELQLLATAMKQLDELRNQYSMLKNTYDNAQNQLNSLNNLKNMNSGHYGFGELENGLDQLKSWQSPTSTWDEALRSLSGGNPARYESLVKAYEANHPALSDANTTKYMSAETATRFKQDKAVNRAVQVQTTEAYDQINQHMEALQKLSKQIEKTENTKGAIDLNSRLITEIGFIQLMNLRLQTLVSQQLSQDSLSELSDRAEMAKFNRVAK